MLKWNCPKCQNELRLEFFNGMINASKLCPNCGINLKAKLKTSTIFKLILFVLLISVGSILSKIENDWRMVSVVFFIGALYLAIKSRSLI